MAEEPTRDDCIVECYNYADRREVIIECETWSEACDRYHEEVARGGWDKIFLYGWWYILNGGWFKGAEKVWNKGNKS